MLEVQHEGDWEHILIQLQNVPKTENFMNLNEMNAIVNDTKISGRFYAQHDHPYRTQSMETPTMYDGNGIKNQDGTHTLIFVAQGTHATYPSTSDCNNSAYYEEIGCPSVNKDTQWFTWSNNISASRKRIQGGGLINVGELKYPLNGQIFIQYTGRWGELGIPTPDIINKPHGPVTPTFQKWHSGNLQKCYKWDAYAIDPRNCN